MAISGPSPEGHAANQLFVGQGVMDMAVTKESRYAVGVFANGDALCQAHQELVEQGFPESDICLMAPANIVNASLAPHAPGILKKLGLVGEKGRSMRELMGKLGASGTHCAAGTVFTSEGSLCDCLEDGSSEDEGTWLSEVLGRWISRRSAEYFEDRLGEGKILMWVPMGHHNYSRREHLACNVLLHHASESVRVLDFALRN